MLSPKRSAAWGRRFVTILSSATASISSPGSSMELDGVIRPKQCVIRCHHSPPPLPAPYRWRKLTWTSGARSRTSSPPPHPPPPLPPHELLHGPPYSGQCSRAKRSSRTDRSSGTCRSSRAERSSRAGRLSRTDRSSRTVRSSKTDRSLRTNRSSWTGRSLSWTDRSWMVCPLLTSVSEGELMTGVSSGADVTCCGCACDWRCLKERWL